MGKKDTVWQLSYLSLTFRGFEAVMAVLPIMVIVVLGMRVGGFSAGGRRGFLAVRGGASGHGEDRGGKCGAQGETFFFHSAPEYWK